MRQTEHNTGDIDIPRLLVVSHNSFSDTKNNGKTMVSFFRGWPIDRVAQLFFIAEEPDTSICQNYYRVTDADILRSLLGQESECGGVILPDIDKKGTEKPYVFAERMKNSNLARMVRDLLWFINNKKKVPLAKWLDDYDPQVLFFTAGDALFSYRIVADIIRARKIPYIIYITDDYILPHFSLNVFYWLRLFLIRRYFKKAIADASEILLIGDKMAQRYKKVFGIHGRVVMNCVDITCNSMPYGRNANMVRMVYIGALHYKRWKTLAQIGRVLEKLKIEGINAQLDIYCLEKPKGYILKKITIPGCSDYKGALNSEGVRRTMSEADILVHVEAFDYSSRMKTSLSVSSKIPEYVAAGKCILAVGPENVASLQYLSDNDVAFCISDLKKDISKIRSIIEDGELRGRYGRRAREIAEINHNEQNVRNTVRNIVLKAISNSNE